MSNRLLRTFGSSADRYMIWDGILDRLSLVGPARPLGFNRISPRFELKWVAGQRGKPSLNADIQNAAEGTRMIADPDFEILGTNSTSALSTFYAEGGILLTTAGADHDQMIVLPHLDANQSAWTQVTWGTDQEAQWECELKSHATITTVVYWAGLKLTNTSVTATDNEQAFFRFQPSVSANWQAIYSIGGVDTAVDTGVVVAASTTYHLRVQIDSSRIAKFYINGVLVATSTALTAGDLIPYIGVQAEGVGAARALYVRGQSISRLFA